MTMTAEERAAWLAGQYDFNAAIQEAVGLAICEAVEQEREACAQLMETKVMDLTRAYEQPPPMVDWNPACGATPGMMARAAAIRARGEEQETA